MLMFSIGFYIHIWFGSLIALSMIVSVTSALFIVPALVMTFRPRFLFVGKRQVASAPPSAHVAIPEGRSGVAS